MVSYPLDTMNSENQAGTEQPAARKAVGEWFWRFLAAVMLFSVGWVLWISYQINPPLLVTNAAFEAAAKAKANQNASGVIAPKPAAEAKPEAEAPKPPAEPPAADRVAKEPPVNVEKLKLSDSITAPPAEEAKKN
jgi:hypothetical protein